MKEKYLSAPQIAKMLKISKEKVFLLAKHGLFPKPILLHTGAQLWSETAVKNWMNIRFKTEDWVTKDIDSELF
jgi:predicted DNA-binding transcriptional regulator AlpA